MKITITDECIGCGACEAVAPEYFEMGNNKPKVKKPEKEDIGKLKEAVDCCPVNAIRLE